jgi:hypothetical protein
MIAGVDSREGNIFTFSMVGLSLGCSGTEAGEATQFKGCKSTEGPGTEAVIGACGEGRLVATCST